MYWKKSIPDEVEIKKRKKQEQINNSEWGVKYPSWDKKHRDWYNQKNKEKKRRTEYKSRGKHFIQNSATLEELDMYQELIDERRRYLKTLESQKKYNRRVRAEAKARGEEHW